VGFLKLWRALRAKNACKTCALGMGGQLGGMRNEAGRWPEVCKKSLQAMIGDMQGRIEPRFFERYSIDELRRLSSRELEACGRLTEPLIAAAGDSHYRACSWDEALSRTAEGLQSASPDECFFYASGRSSNEAGFLFQLFARLYGTNYINNCSYYCHQASSVGLTRSLGTGTATIVLEDLEKADLFFLIGGNPPSNHPRLMKSLLGIRRRGGHVIVINPAREVGLVNFRVPSDLRSLLFGSSIASLYLQPHIGGDMALLAGIAKVLIEGGTVDQAFIDQCTDGYLEYRRHVEAADWTEIEAASGVLRKSIIEAANLYAKSHRTIFGWTMGITQHLHGVANVESIVNLALLRGMVGREGSGVLPIRGHSNVQGLGSVGVAPILKEATFQKLEALLGVSLPSGPGLDTMGSVLAASRGEIRSAICLGGNLFGSNPDAAFASSALSKIGRIAYLSTSLNTGHVWGRGEETIILPVLARDEECQRTSQESMFNYVRLSEGGPARHVGPKSEVEIVGSLARLVTGDQGRVRWEDFLDHAAIRRLIGQVVAGYEAMGSEDGSSREFQVGGRTFHSPRFNTDDGKAKFHTSSWPHWQPKGNHLLLMTVRSEGQFNTVVYEEEDIYRGQERRDVILMNSVDLVRLGLAHDQVVTVTSSAGSMSGIRARAFDIRAGNAIMYYPEANVLVPAAWDPDSKTPGFKSVMITVEPEARSDQRRPLEMAATKG
jgi:molybdopterin-dependent oxidoreductase alpha subunit